MTTYALSEGHKFRGPSSDFLYLVPSGGIFALDPLSSAIVDALNVGPLNREQLIGRVSQKVARPPVEIAECVEELCQVRAIRDEATHFIDKPEPLPEHFPLQTLVMNVTNQCNLSCHYCYEFGEDKIATPERRIRPRHCSSTNTCSPKAANPCTSPSSVAKRS